MKYSWLCQYWILLLPFLSLSNYLVVASGFQIDLEVGSIQGKIDAAKPSDKAFASFTSIPYAEPPIGKLRFKDPVGKKYALNYVKFALNTSSFFQILHQLYNVQFHELFRIRIIITGL